MIQYHFHNDSHVPIDSTPDRARRQRVFYD
jgi:hypothetical protein